MDTNKLIKIGKEINRYMGNASNDFNMKLLAPYMDFKVINDGSDIDEPFEIDLNGLEYYDDCEGTLGDNNSMQKVKENKSKLLSDYGDELEYFMDNTDTELTKEDELLFLDTINKIVAKKIIQINHRLTEEFIDKFEKGMKQLSEEVEGFRYEDWEEYSLTFYVDGKRCTYGVWSNCIEYEKDDEGNTDEVIWDD